MATSNEYTGKAGESDRQIEVRVRKENPTLNDEKIQQLIAIEKSIDTNLNISRNIFKFN